MQFMAFDLGRNKHEMSGLFYGIMISLPCSPKCEWTCKTYNTLKLLFAQKSDKQNEVILSKMSKVFYFTYMVDVKAFPLFPNWKGRWENGCECHAHLTCSSWSSQMGAASPQDFTSLLRSSDYSTQHYTEIF